MKLTNVVYFWATMALVACHPSEENSSIFSSELNCRNLLPADQQTQFPSAKEFVAEVANFIMKENPDTFKGEFAPESFCFRIFDSPQINANANVVTKQITINTGTLYAAQSELSIAEIISHELAHVTLQHYGPLSFRDFQKLSTEGEGVAQFDEVKASAINKMGAMNEVNLSQHRYNSAMREARDYSLASATLVSRYFAAIDTLRENSHINQYDPERFEEFEVIASQIKGELYSGLNDSLRQDLLAATDALDRAQTRLGEAMAHYQVLESEIDRLGFERLSTEQAANGREIEADEHGLRYYLKAGLRFAGSIGHFHRMSVILENGGDPQSELSPLSICLSELYEARRLIPDRGTMTHPLPCWRWYNVAVKMPLQYADELTPLIRDANLSTIATSVSLSEVKEEVGPQDFRELPTPPLGEGQDFSSDVHDRQSVCVEMGGTWRTHPDFAYCELPYDQSNFE